MDKLLSKLLSIFPVIFFFVQVPDCDYFYIIKILSSIHGLITLIGGGVLKVKGFGEARV